MHPAPQLKDLGWFTGCFGPYQARAAGVQARVRGSGGLVCIDRGGLHLSQAPSPLTQIVMTLGNGKGEVSFRFATSPHTLRVTPLDREDRPSSSGSNIDRVDSSVARCLVHDASITSLTLEAGRRGGRDQVPDPWQQAGSGGTRCCQGLHSTRPDQPVCRRLSDTGRRGQKRSTGTVQAPQPDSWRCQQPLRIGAIKSCPPPWLERSMESPRRASRLERWLPRSPTLVAPFL